MAQDADKQEIEQKTATLYGDLFSVRNISMEKELEEFKARTGISDLKGMKCIDAGFGSGRGVMAMMALGGDVHGIDLSEENLRNAVARSGNKNLRQGSVLDIPFENEAFDFVYCNGVIHHTTDPEKAFSELARVLKKGGMLFLSVYGKGLSGRMISAARTLNPIPYRYFPLKSTMWRDLMYVPRLKRYSIEEVKDMLSRHNITFLQRIYKPSRLQKSYIMVLGRKA